MSYTDRMIPGAVSPKRHNTTSGASETERIMGAIERHQGRLAIRRTRLRRERKKSGKRRERNGLLHTIRDMTAYLTMLDTLYDRTLAVHRELAVKVEQRRATRGRRAGMDETPDDVD